MFKDNEEEIKYEATESTFASTDGNTFGGTMQPGCFGGDRLRLKIGELRNLEPGFWYGVFPEH